MIKTSKKKLLTIDQFNKCSFYFEQGRPIECVQDNTHICRIKGCGGAGWAPHQ